MTDLTKKEILDQAPAFFGEMTGPNGMEDFTADSVVVPFFRIVQPLSDVPEGVNPGDFFSPSTGKTYGKTVKVICVGFYQNYLHRGPGEGKESKFMGTVTKEAFSHIESGLTRDGGKMVAPNGEKYSDARNHFVMVADDLGSGIMLWTMESTGVGTSRAWNSRMAAIKANKNGVMITAPIYSKVWELSTVKVSGDKGVYYTVDTKAIKDCGWITADQFPVVQAAFAEVQELKGKPIKMVDDTTAEDEEAPF